MTKDYKGRIFALNLVMGVAALGSIAPLVVGGADPESLWISLFDCVWFVTLLAVNAVVYHELRVIKDTTAMGTSRTLLNLT